MIGRRKAAELHRRYGRFEYPIDAEDVAAKAVGPDPEHEATLKYFPPESANRTLRELVE